MSDILARQAQNWLQRSPSCRGVVNKLCKDRAEFAAIRQLRIAVRQAGRLDYRILSVTDAFFLMRRATAPSRAINVVMDRLRAYRKPRTGFPTWNMPPEDAWSSVATTCWCYVRPGQKHWPRFHSAQAILQFGFPGEVTLQYRFHARPMRRVVDMYWQFQTLARSAAPAPFAAHLGRE